MTYWGHVRKGKIELDNDVRLPEGVKVELRLSSPPAPIGDSEHHPPATSQRQQAIQLLDSWYSAPDTKTSEYWDDLGRDMSENRFAFRDMSNE